MLREDSTQASAENMLKADLAQKGRMNIYKIFIRGNRTPGFWLLPEKLKIKLILIDVFDNSEPPEPPRYYVSSTHLDCWRYTPPESPRIIETNFT